MMKIYTILKKPIIKSLLLCTIILLIGEFSLWGLEDSGSIGEPYDWGNRNVVAVKVNECMNLFRNNPEKFKIVAIGDSMMELDLDPFLLDSFFQNKTITYNLAISATAIRFQSVFIKEVIFRRIKPDFVLWHFNNWDFWDWEFINNEENKILGTPCGRFYTGNTTGLSLEELFNYNLMKYSRIWRYKSNLLPSKIPASSDAQDHENTYERGYWRTFENFYTSNETSITDLSGISTSERDSGIKFHEPSKDLLYKTLEFICSSGSDYLTIYGPFCHKKIVFPELDVTLSAIPNSKFLDLNGNESLESDELYYNYFHLNALGAQVFTNFTYQKIRDRILSKL